MSKPIENEKLRTEYDFSKGIRGKHFRALEERPNVVLLEPDVAGIFKDSASVNRALRLLMDIAGREISQNMTGDNTQSF